jgi:hypothetical protein
MFVTLVAGALLNLGAHPDPCAMPLPRGPSVPAPLVLSTDCGWYSLRTDGEVTRFPGDWYATHHERWHPPYGLTYRRTHAGRYLAVRDGRVVWRSAGLYFNEDGSGTFGPHAFAFGSWRRRGVLLTDLRGPEQLVVQGRLAYPIGFTQGKLLVSGRRTITVVSAGGTVLRRLRYRRSSSFAFDQQTETLYFVSPGGVLTEVSGSAIRRIAKLREQGWVGLLGRRLLTIGSAHRMAVLRRDDGSLVASARWRRGGSDAGVSVSDDGKLFAFRVVGADQPETATVYVLRAGEREAHAVYRNRFRQSGCGYSVSLDWEGSSLLYRSDDGSGVAEAALLAPNGSAARLTPLLRALPRISSGAPGNVFWATDFLG